MLTTVYLIHRLPSKVLGNISPYEMLHKEVPDYDKLRSFGCLAFASTNLQSSDKLEKRATPCVFIVYPPDKKGYRLLDLTDNSVIISRDITFKELVFPLNVNSTYKYMDPVPVLVPKPVAYTDTDLMMSYENHNSDTGHSSARFEAKTSHQPRVSTRIRKPPSGWQTTLQILLLMKTLL